MLDIYGFAAELNGTNIFMVKEGIVYTPFADACLPGITRKLVIKLCTENNISLKEKNLSLTELYNADEVFCSGTMGELTPIMELDGRRIDNSNGESLLPQLQVHFEALREKYCTPLEHLVS